MLFISACSIELSVEKSIKVGTLQVYIHENSEVLFLFFVLIMDIFLECFIMKL